MFANRIGLPPGFTIHDREDAADLVNLVRHELGLSDKATRFPLKATCLAIYSHTVNSGRPLEEVLARHFPWCAGFAEDLRRLFQAYVEAKVLRRLSAPGVTWLGAIGPDQKVPLLRDARALLAPIEWNEPFGLILIEALLSGCPVVAFGRGSVPELVEHGVTGFVAASENDMVALLRPGGPVDALDRGRIREIAVRRFDRARMVAEYERVYRAAVARARDPGLTPITAA